MKYAKFKGAGGHYFALNDERNENGLWHGISVQDGQQKSVCTVALLGTWFGTMYEACTQQEFETAYKNVVEHILNAYPINKKS